MTKRKGSSRRKSRHKMQKALNEKGKVSISKYFQVLNIGDKVALTMDSSVHQGMYLPRFYGRIGTVKSKKGKCYEVEIYDGNARKNIIAHPVHLKKV